mmetsp:Transcript_87034/g.269459  ORF Transcript_87034/g.269459 Transcript_87034/m.269459 type:complete len:228 (-) Transcript_87034:44-727(-)
MNPKPNRWPAAAAIFAALVAASSEQTLSSPTPRPPQTVLTSMSSRESVVDFTKASTSGNSSSDGRYMTRRGLRSSGLRPAMAARARWRITVASLPPLKATRRPSGPSRRSAESRTSSPWAMRLSLSWPPSAARRITSRSLSAARFVVVSTVVVAAAQAAHDAGAGRLRRSCDLRQPEQTRPAANRSSKWPRPPCAGAPVGAGRCPTACPGAGSCSGSSRAPPRVSFI